MPMPMSVRTQVHARTRPWQWNAWGRLGGIYQGWHDM